MRFANKPITTQLYGHAMRFVLERYDNQITAAGTPLLSELLSVSALILEVGGSEDQAIAGLLHRSLDLVDYKFIASFFSVTIAEIVFDLTPPGSEFMSELEKQQWYRHSVKYSGGGRSILVSAAISLYNLRQLATTHQQRWRPEYEAYYRELFSIYRLSTEVPKEWIEEMENHVKGLTEIIASAPYDVSKIKQ